jgi:hypothetical protein
MLVVRLAAVMAAVPHAAGVASGAAGRLRQLGVHLVPWCGWRVQSLCIGTRRCARPGKCWQACCAAPCVSLVAVVKDWQSYTLETAGLGARSCRRAHTNCLPMPRAHTTRRHHTPSHGSHMLPCASTTHSCCVTRTAVNTVLAGLANSPRASCSWRRVANGRNASGTAGPASDRRPPAASGADVRASSHVPAGDAAPGGECARSIRVLQQRLSGACLPRHPPSRCRRARRPNLAAASGGQAVRQLHALCVGSLPGELSGAARLRGVVSQARWQRLEAPQTARTGRHHPLAAAHTCAGRAKCPVVLPGGAPRGRQPHQASHNTCSKQVQRALCDVQAIEGWWCGTSIGGSSWLHCCGCVVALPGIAAIHARGGMRNARVCVMTGLRPAHRTAPHRTAPHRTAPHRTAPHRTAPHRTAPHRTAPHRTQLGRHHVWGCAQHPGAAAGRRSALLQRPARAGCCRACPRQRPAPEAAGRPGWPAVRAPVPAAGSSSKGRLHAT